MATTFRFKLNRGERIWFRSPVTTPHGVVPAGTLASFQGQQGADVTVSVNVGDKVRFVTANCHNFTA